MQLTRFVDISTFIFYHEVFFESIEELSRCETIQIFHYTVVIDNSELACRETNCHKVVIFLFTGVMWILFSFLSSYQSGSCRTVVTVGNIERRHFSKFLSHCCDIFFVVDNPKLMTEAIVWSYEIVYRSIDGIFSYQFIEYFI